MGMGVFQRVSWGLGASVGILFFVLPQRRRPCCLVDWGMSILGLVTRRTVAEQVILLRVMKGVFKYGLCYGIMVLAQDGVDAHQYIEIENLYLDVDEIHLHVAVRHLPM